MSRQQRDVRGRRVVRSARGELRQPEPVQVGLVADDQSRGRLARSPAPSGELLLRLGRQRRPAPAEGRPIDEERGCRRARPASRRIRTARYRDRPTRSGPGSTAGDAHRLCRRAERAPPSPSPPSVAWLGASSVAPTTRATGQGGPRRRPSASVAARTAIHAGQIAHRIIGRNDIKKPVTTLARAGARADRDQLKALPAKPGVYLFRGGGRGALRREGEVAAPRVRSYFQRGGHGARIARIRPASTDVEVIVTATEAEALHLEQNLISATGRRSTSGCATTSRSRTSPSPSRTSTRGSCSRASATGAASSTSARTRTRRRCGRRSTS